MKETSLAFHDSSCDLVDRLLWANIRSTNHTKPQGTNVKLIERSPPEGDRAMTKRTVAGLTLVVLVLSLSMTGKSVQRDPSMQTFWIKFKAAVIKGDKAAVAQMSQFPIELEYGIPSVKTSAQLIKRYREVFNGETNAAKCFAESKPEVDPQNSKRFTVGCKIENTGDVVIIYGFVRTKTGWKFNSLDNINE